MDRENRVADHEILSSLRRLAVNDPVAREVIGWAYNEGSLRDALAWGFAKLSRQKKLLEDKLREE
jgi:hypothetical protein